MSKKDEFVAPPGCDCRSAFLVAGSWYLILVLFVSGWIGYNMMNPACTPTTCPNNYIEQTV